MSQTIKLSYSPFSCESYQYGGRSMDYRQRVAYMQKVKFTYNRLQNIFAIESMLSSIPNSVPPGPTFIAKQPPIDRQTILSNIVSSYYEDVLLSKFLQVTDYLIGVADELPENVQVEFESSLVMDIDNGLNKILTYISRGILPELRNVVDSIEASGDKKFNIPDLKSYLNSGFKLINQYRSELIPLYTRTESVSDFVNEALSRDTDCAACLTNRLVLAFYRNAIELLISVGKGVIPNDLYDIIVKFKSDIEPIEKRDIDSHIAELVGDVDLETGIALEANNQGIVKRVWEHIKAIFKFIKNKIVAFFKFIVRLVTRQKDIKQKIEEETNNLTPEEKQKAEDAGQPTYHMDSENKEIHATDKNGKYIVSMKLNSPNPFVKKNSEEVEKKIEENKDQVKPMKRGLASLEEILSGWYSKSETVDNLIYSLIINGKDPAEIMVKSAKLIYDYLSVDFNQEASSAISKSKTDKGVLSLGSGSFSKLEKVLSEVNTLVGGDIEKNGSIDVYVRNTMRDLNDNDEETKFDDAFINKVKDLKINTSYEAFVKVADQDVPNVRESLFSGITDNEQGVFCNKVLRIYQNLVSIYRNFIRRGTTYYQLVYIPLAVAHNIGEVGEKATKLFAAKRKEEADKKAAEDNE